MEGDAWDSGLNYRADGGSTDGNGHTGSRHGGVIGWDRVVRTTSGLRGKSLLCGNEGSGFSEVRNPDFFHKALGFYMFVIKSNLKCHVG